MKWPSSFNNLSATQSSHHHHYRSLLRSFAKSSPSLEETQKLHATLLKNGVSSTPNSYLHNALLQVYIACATPHFARKVFDEIPQSHKDTVDWTTMMSCYTRNSQPNEALRLFFAMREEGVCPDEVTFVCLFTACSRLGDIVAGIQGHVFMIKHGFPFTVTASNAAMDMYVKCCRINDARRVFDEMGVRSVVSWTVFLTGVLKLEGVEKGRVVFDMMPERNEVSWTVMVTGCVESGLTKEAFAYLENMVFSSGVTLNYVTLCSLLSACSQSGDLLMGRWIHAYALKTVEKDLHLMVGTALVDMYSKCGRIDRARRVFENLSYRTVVAWNALFSGLAMHGKGIDVLNLFPRMMREVKPDDITFVALLSACSHSGLVDQGCQYFRDLEPLYGVTPKMEHYSCMVDLLGRAGRLEEAEILIKKMPIRPNEVVLGSLLGSCGLHGKLDVGERLLKELMQIEPLNTEYHVLLSNMYTLAGRQYEADFLRQDLKIRGIQKVPGLSSIHIDGTIHQFCAGDKSHPRTQDVYVKLDEMVQRMRSVGYIPNTGSQISFGSESGRNDGEVLEEKEQALFSHSEKLAISFGLISTTPGTRLHIFKNLRICQDCHSAVKLISDIYNREIIIRDRNRFHCFNHGSCSCSDYW